MSEAARYPRVAAMKTADAFAHHLAAERITLGFDRELAPAGASPLAQSFQIGDIRVGNRFCVLPMEGWDGTRRGRAERPHHSPLAEFWQERRQVDLGRRGGGRAS